MEEEEEGGEGEAMGGGVEEFEEMEDEEQSPAPSLPQNASFSTAASLIAWFRSISINTEETHSFFLTEKGVTFSKKGRNLGSSEAEQGETGMMASFTGRKLSSRSLR